MRKILDLFLILSNIKLLKFLLLRKPFSISSFKNLKVINKYQNAFSTVIDIGANKGQFAFAAQYFFPDANIYCFEPSKKNYTKLALNFKSNPRVKIFNFGLGDENEEREFFEHSFDQISSFLKVTSTNKNQNYKDSIPTVSKLTVKRLDDIDGLDFIAPVLLKLDVQGYEEKILLGSINSLKKIDYLMIEMPFEKLYETQKLFSEMHSIIINLGFILLAPIGFNTGKDNNIIEIDALYKKHLITT